MGHDAKMFHPAAQKLGGKTDLKNFPDSLSCFILASSAAFSSPNPPDHESSITLQQSGMMKLATQSEAGKLQVGVSAGAGWSGDRVLSCFVIALHSLAVCKRCS